MEVIAKLKPGFRFFGTVCKHHDATRCYNESRSGRWSISNWRQRWRSWWRWWRRWWRWWRQLVPGSSSTLPRSVSWVRQRTWQSQTVLPRLRQTAALFRSRMVRQTQPYRWKQSPRNKPGRATDAILAPVGWINVLLLLHLQQQKCSPVRR